MMHQRFRRFIAAAAVSALVSVGAAGIAVVPGGALRAQQAQPQINAQDVIPFDAAVRTATLPNGVKVFIRQNAQPAKRVALRLAIKAGSIHEADDQQGLAHLIEHMAFNGSAHFKPGELISAFESIGARLGPHVNAYTSFDETVYMLELPSDKPEIVTKGLTAMADFAGGLTLDPAEIDKERGVVVEEWRGGLGAGSRIRDKQVPVLFYRSRYAERLPIGKPEVLRTAPAARLRAFYDTWYRPDRMAIIVVGDIDPQQIEQGIRTVFEPLAARAPAAPEPDRTVPLHQELLVNVATDPELTRSNVQLVRKRASQNGQRVADYRRGLVHRLVDYMFGERFTELARRPDSKFLGAGAGGDSLSPTVDAFILSAGCPGRAHPGRAVVARRSKPSACGSSGSARPSSSARSAGWRASWSGRTTSATRPKAARTRRSISATSSKASPRPASRTNTGSSRNCSPPSRPPKSRPSRGRSSATTAACCSPLRRRRRMSRCRPRRSFRRRWRRPKTWPSPRGTRRRSRAISWKRSRRPRRSPRGVKCPDVGVTIVRFANGVEAWLKPTDFKNDQVLFDLAGARRRVAGRMCGSPRGAVVDLVRGTGRRWRPQGARPAEAAGRQARVRLALRWALDAWHFRRRAARAARNGAATALPELHRAERRRGGVRPADTPAGGGRRQPRAVSAADLRGPPLGGEYLGALHVERRSRPSASSRSTARR